MSNVALASPSAVDRYLANLQAEIDSAALYRGLADAEGNAELADLYRRLAAVEERHIAFWQDKLTAAGLKPEFAEVTMKPTTEVTMAGDDAQRMQKLLDAIESIDDVQEVYTNALLEEV